MENMPFAYSALFRTDLPPPAQPYNGFPKYNFVGGHNDADSTPVEGLIAAATAVLQREGRSLATYGLDSGPLGYRPLREFLAAKLERTAGIAATADQILVTSGSLQGLDLINQVLVARGDTVVIEDATYGGVLTRLKRIGANIIGVPLDREGMRMDALAATLEQLKSQGVAPRYIYTIPTVQNPTGSIMPVARRAELIRLAAAHHVPIVEDECYSDLVWAGTRPPALMAMSDMAHVIHVGSFSKSIAPALRVGYIAAGWEVLSRLLSVKSDAGSGALEQMVVAEYCVRHFDEHIAGLSRTLEGKLDVLIEALGEQFGTAAEFERPAGGIFLWVRLPETVDTTRLAQVALTAGIAINPGVEWSIDPLAGKRSLRICFAHPSKQTLRAGVQSLAEVCHREMGVPARIANVERSK